MNLNAQRAHAAYREGQVSASNPVRIVVLLFEGAVRFCRQALESFDDISQRGHALGRAHAIVSELMVSLDHDQGGEIAENLDAIYRFALGELIRTNLDNDRAALAALIPVLEVLATTWREVEVTHREGGAP